MIRLASPLVLTLAVAGLSVRAFAQSSVDGVWRLSGTSMPKGVSGTATFRKGAVRFVVSGPQEGMTINLTASGAYTLRGDLLTLRFSDAKMTSKDFTSAQRLQSEPPKVRADMHRSAAQQNTSGRIRFTGPNKFVMTEKSGKQTVFTRTR